MEEETPKEKTGMERIEDLEKLVKSQDQAMQALMIRVSRLEAEKNPNRFNSPPYGAQRQPNQTQPGWNETAQVAHCSLCGLTYLGYHSCPNLNVTSTSTTIYGPSGSVGAGGTGYKKVVGYSASPVSKALAEKQEELRQAMNRVKNGLVKPTIDIDQSF